MKYAEKIRHAEKAAEDLINKVSIETVRGGLKEKGLYETDIDNVISSARKIIGEKVKPIIRQKMLAGETLVNAPEFADIDPATLKKMAEQEIQAIINGERDKVKKMLNEGASHSEIYKSVRQDFYAKENIDHQISVHQEVKQQNSGGSRMLNIVGGILLMVVGIGISLASMDSGSGGRVFYGLVAVGFFMMIKGFMTVENPY